MGMPAQCPERLVSIYLLNFPTQENFWQNLKVNFIWNIFAIYMTSFYPRTRKVKKNI